MSVSTVQAPAGTPGLEHKAASTSPESGLLDADDATGVVEAIVSVTGLLDEDHDVILPGAYTKTLTKRRPKGIFVHDWGRWVARTEHIEELMPGDDRLPKQTKDGRPWPSQAGGLYVRCRFNLSTTEGKDAYENVKFFSESGECEWSVGYKVPPGKSTKTKSGERHIQEIDLFEYSPVLFGAAPLSGTLSVKSAQPAGTVLEDLEDAEGDLGDDEDALHEGVEELDDLEELEVAADALADDSLPDLEDNPEGDDDADDEGKGMGTGLDRSPKKNWVEMTGKLPAYIEEIAKSVHEKRGLPLDQAIPTAIAMVKKWAAGGEDVKPATRAKAAKAVAQWEALKARAGKKDAESKELFNLNPPPLSNRLDLFREWRNMQVPDISETTMRDRVHAALFRMDQALKRGEVSEAEAALKVVLSALRKAGQDPTILSFTEGALAALRAGGRDVAQQRGPGAYETRGKSLDTEDLDEESEEAEETGLFPHLSGTYEELREHLREGASKALGGESAGLTHVEVMGTWSTHAVVTAYHYDQEAKSYEMPYTLVEDQDGVSLTLEEPIPVELKVTMDGLEEDSSGLLPYPSVLEEVTLDLKALLSDGETKAGRVLSGINEKRLLAAVENLVAVLRAAGLEVAPKPNPHDDAETDALVQQAQYQDSTAPSARTNTATTGKKFLDPSLLARAYRVVGDAHTLT